MSYNDPFESEGTAGTVNFDAPAGGGRYDSSGFSSDSDSGSPTFTRGKPGSRGGTQISGNTIYGGQIVSDKTLGRSYDFESEDYQKYLDATGRSMQNPYGNTGLFSGIFGADKVNYNLDPTTAKNILDAGFDRYNDFLGQDSISQNRGFGKLFGGPEGEMTAQGEVRKQVTPMSTSDMAARLAGTASGLGAPLSMLPGRNVGYAPMGSSGYNPQLDPQVNSDLKSGPFSLLTGGVNIPEAFGRVKDFITSKSSPAEELAAQTQTEARGPDLSELSQTVSGGRFEDESARPQVMTPVETAMDALQTKIDEAGLTGRQRDNFLNDVIAQREGSTTSLNKDLVLAYSPEATESLAADYQIAAARLKEMEDFNAAPTYPQSQNFGNRQLDPINPLTVDFLDNINLGQFGEIVGKARSGDLLSTQTPFGQLSFEPEFKGSRPVGGMIRLKGQF